MKNDWIGKKTKPDYYMDLHTYAHNYVAEFNKLPDSLNREYRERGLGNYLQLRRLNVLFFLNENLEGINCLGTYTADKGITIKSTIGSIRIDIKAHRGNYEKIKETVRHEIAHAIAHQINGCKNNSHNNTWIEIAEEHKVNIDHYKAELT